MSNKPSSVLEQGRFATGQPDAASGIAAVRRGLETQIQGHLEMFFHRGSSRSSLRAHKATALDPGRGHGGTLSGGRNDLAEARLGEGLVDGPDNHQGGVDEPAGAEPHAVRAGSVGS